MKFASSLRSCSEAPCSRIVCSASGSGAISVLKNGLIQAIGIQKLVELRHVLSFAT